MKKNYLGYLIVFAFIVAIIASCGDSEFPGFKKTDTGLYYKFYEQNDDTLKPGQGDFVTLDLTYGNEDTIIFNSDRMPEGLTFALDNPFHKGDLYEGLMMMSEGDSATFLISADSFFYKAARAPKLPSYIDSGSYLSFNVRLKDIETKLEKEIKEQARLEERRAQEPVDLQTFLEENNITVEPTEDGIYFIPEKQGSGKSPAAGQMVSIHLTVSLVDGTRIFSSHDRGEPIEFEFGKKFDTEGLEKGIGMMKKGGKAKVIVPSEMAYGAESRGNLVDAYSTIVYDIELMNIRSAEDYRKEQDKLREQREAEEAKIKENEKQQIRQYLKDQGLQGAPSVTGLYYIETEEGTGAQAEAGKTVRVHYTGTLFDGRKFDSSLDRGEPFQFVLGEGQVIKGWDEGIARMKEGGKAILIIPSWLAYGKRGAGQDIDPDTPLRFDVELVEVVEE
jgi:peptidylprolyl isomerase